MRESPILVALLVRICKNYSTIAETIPKRKILFVALATSQGMLHATASLWEMKIVSIKNNPRRIDGAIIPRDNILVNGQPACALIDSNCTQTLIGPNIQTGKAYGFKRIMTADGRIINCTGEIPVLLSLAGKTIEVL